MDRFLKVFQQTSWQMIGKVITSTSTIIILGVVSRSFGEEGTGLLTLALAFLGFFNLTVDLGLNAYLLPKFLEAKQKKTFQKLLGLRILLALVSCLIGVVAIVLWPSGGLGFKKLVLIGLIPAIFQPAVYVTTSAIFQAKLRYDLVITAWALGATTTLAAVVLITFFHLGIEATMLGYSLGWLVVMVVSLLLIKGYVKNILPEFDFSFIKDLFKNAWPVSLTLVLNLVYFRLDAFLISFFRNFNEVGIYNLPYSVFQSILVIPTYIMNGYYPLMIKSLKEDRVKFFKELKLGSLLMSAIGLSAAVGTYFLSPFIILVLTGGKGFGGSVEALQILGAGFPLFFVSALLMWALVTLKEYKSLVKIYAAGLLVNISFNLFFIPKYSYIAASWTTVISEGVILFLQVLVLKFGGKR